MKKVALLLFVWMGVLISSAQAQTEKGRWMAGTQIGDFTYSGQYGQRNFSASLSPSAGYFVANGLLVGARVPLSYASVRYPEYNSNGTSPVPAKSIATSYGLGPFVRYYVGSAKVKPYIGLSYTYSLTNTKQTSSARETVKNSSHYSLIVPTLGVAYFVTRNVALNAGLNYNSYRSTYEADQPTPGTYTDTSKSFSLGIGFDLFFGQ
ncbi:outer membrane beta-barrel protein [Spirosoma oryzicola]|uniref:outer membrane beta-barrel protein n=1 Tax=Spirosoma oryzicola TaxID=2898794 RepID=UPI001E2BD8B0|nr:outer membrane beta-barrel protein [Spirosoma oryzicola]UHG93466.1 outer membrane beta-barrel protein [Spirosoma oryzicola]